MYETKFCFCVRYDFCQIRFFWKTKLLRKWHIKIHHDKESFQQVSECSNSENTKKETLWKRCRNEFVLVFSTFVSLNAELNKPHENRVVLLNHMINYIINLLTFFTLTSWNPSIINFKESAVEDPFRKICSLRTCKSFRKKFYNLDFIELVPDFLLAARNKY